MMCICHDACHQGLCPSCTDPALGCAYQRELLALTHPVYTRFERVSLKQAMEWAETHRRLGQHPRFYYHEVHRRFYLVMEEQPR